MNFVLKNKTLYTSEQVAGVANENKSEHIIIDISNESSLNTKWAFLEFKTNDGYKYTTAQLEIVDNTIEYSIPNSVLIYGFLQMQLVFRYEDDWIWKSYIVNLIVRESINAGNDIPQEYPEFVVDVYTRLNALSEETEEINVRLSALEENTVPAKLSALPETQGREYAYVYIDDNGIRTKISIDELGKRIINTNEPKENEKGQYTFLEIEGE